MKKIFFYMLVLALIISVVSAEEIKVNLNEKFELKVGQIAVVGGTGVSINYYSYFKNECPSCMTAQDCPPCEDGGVSIIVSTATNETPSSITAGGRMNVYDVVITLLEAKDDNSAVLFVTKKGAEVAPPQPVVVVTPSQPVADVVPQPVVVVTPSQPAADVIIPPQIVTPSMQQVPMCDAIGTRSEGWYLSGVLLRYDDCACEAVCKGSGYYSSCTGELIQKSDCQTDSSSVSTLSRVNNKESVKAMTNENILVKDDKLYISTSKGDKEIRYMPVDATQKAVQLKKFDEVSNIQFKKDNEKLVYEITGKRTSNFLWIFPITVEETVKIDAQTNQIIK